VTILPKLTRWTSAALAFVYPEVCQICRAHRAGPRESFVCFQCRKDVRKVIPPFCEVCGLPFYGDINVKFECANCGDRRFHFQWARSAVAARGTVLEAIHQYKYQRALWIEPWLAELFVEPAGSQLKAADWDWLVPVPLHPVKEREREFNQATRLAGYLGRATGIGVHSGLLVRVSATRTQTRLSRSEREDNMRDAFAVPPEADVNGKRLIVIDDVFTTGSTTNECARMLRLAGAAQVCVWTLARGI
jgi:ComF family protein